VTKKRLDTAIGNVVDGVTDWCENHWYAPIERVTENMPLWLFILTLPITLVALAIPPLVVSAVLMIPYALVVIGILTLVGVL
jgi:hypothetical protein